jgi:hypothetical protein
MIESRDEAMKHIFSTLGAGTSYTGIERSVVVKGNCRGLWVRGIWKPTPVCTEVSDEDAEFLANHGLFQFHQKGGFVKIEKIARDPGTVASDRR